MYTTDNYPDAIAVCFPVCHKNSFVRLVVTEEKIICVEHRYKDMGATEVRKSYGYAITDIVPDAGGRMFYIEDRNGTTVLKVIMKHGAEEFIFGFKGGICGDAAVSAREISEAIEKVFGM